MFQFYEFFAGGGMVRAGLGAGWRCMFANDIDPMKAATYRANHGADSFHEGDIAGLTTAVLPGRADLAWASFPCQDLSLAGKGAGLEGARSGIFWRFWDLIEGLKAEGRAPRIVALENVTGLLSSNDGRDFAAIGDALAAAGYCFGAAVIDAASFVPQSRPRLFIIATLDWPTEKLQIAAPDPSVHPLRLRDAVTGLSKRAAAAWIWWRIPLPPTRNAAFSDLLDDDPDVPWHKAAETDRLIGMMTLHNRAKVDARLALKTKRYVGTIYKRTRIDDQGVKHQRAEVRFDDLAGCLRTPGGGSSRQTILVIDRGRARSRLISSRETARLMGLPDDYKLPSRYNDAYHVTGDGVVTHVVRHLAETVFEVALAVPSNKRKVV